MKKKYVILTFIIIGFLAIFIEMAYTPKREQGGKLLSAEMTKNIWIETKVLFSTEQNNKQNNEQIDERNNEKNVLEQEQEGENSSQDSESQELAEETNEQNLAALEWGDEPPQHAYDSYWVFPFEEMEYADDKEFGELREIFSEIQFYGGFPLGDEEKYKICKDKYAQLLKNEITVTVPETGEECYLEEFDLVIDKYEDKPYDLERYYFYLFDVDGNDAPELCLFELLSPGIIDSMCIFKYDFDLDKIILWKDFGSHYTLLFGGNSIAGENGNANEFDFYQVDENANLIFRTGFVWEGFFTNGNVVCMVILPQYKNVNKDERIERMKKRHFMKDKQEDIT